MATFLMVHGAWHGGWSFDLLRPGLEKRGHQMIAPDLGGRASDEELARVSLRDWAEQIATLAREQSEKVILCGHSRGGIVISQAAELAPEAIDALVYIAAFMVPDGATLLDFNTPRAPALAAGMVPTAGGAALAFSPAAARTAFYQRTPEDVARAAASRMEPEPVAVLSTPLRLSAGRYGAIDRHYVECSDDQAIALATQRRMQELTPVRSVATLDTDHSPMLSCPDALVAELDRIARLYE